jgi:hypothetical protein
MRDNPGGGTLPERSMIPSGLNLKWFYLAWLSLGATAVVFLVLGTVVRGDPSELILSWSLLATPPFSRSHCGISE